MRTKGPFTPSDSVTVTVTFDGPNWYATHSAHNSVRQKMKDVSRQRYGGGDGVAWCERPFKGEPQIL